jgi:hypothetical protein
MLLKLQKKIIDFRAQVLRLVGHIVRHGRLVGLPWMSTVESQDLDYIKVCTTEQRDVDIAKTHKEDEQGVPMYRKGSRD